MANHRLLIIDDEVGISQLLEELADDMGLEARAVNDPRRLVDVFSSFDPTLVVLDLQMPGLDGIMTLDLIQRLGCTAAIFIISGFGGRVLNSACEFGLSKGLNIRGSFSKPLDLLQFEKTLIEACHTTIKKTTTRVQHDHLTERDIVEALRGQQFFPRYQPKFMIMPNATQKPKVLGAEALARWNHPVLGELNPGQFLPLVEEYGLITEMTEQIVDQVIVDLREWESMGYLPKISLNISPTMLTNLTLPDRYEAKFLRARVAPSRIIFEITESAAMNDVARTTEILTRFRLKGFGLSIDDFGTGFSSLVELYRMPFGELKIDRLFVSKASHDQEARTIVDILINLAHRLGITVCAEGIEDEETLHLLARLNCVHGQGFLIGRPLLHSEFSDQFVRGDRGKASTASN